MFESLARKCRSYRRYDESFQLSAADMKSLISITRYAGCAGNKQIVRYMTLCNPNHTDAIFPCLSWAGYLNDWDAPEAGERPSGYVLVLIPEGAHRYAVFDAALAVQTILLYAVEWGLGGCIIGSVDRKRLSDVFLIPKPYLVEVVVAIGKPRETIVLENANSGNLCYWRDSSDIHHVPKLSIDTLIIPTRLRNET